MSHLLIWFELLSLSRRVTDSGPLGLAPTDIVAWCQLTGNTMSSVEYSMIASMDAAYLNAVYEFRRSERARKESSVKTPPRKRPPRKS